MSFQPPVYTGQQTENSRETFRSFRAEAQQARRDRTGKGRGKGRAEVADLTPKQQSLQSMFAPPTDLMFHGDFEMAKTAARSEGRWLLVNIQKNDEFACHALNRDVWKDDYAKAVIANSLVFWMDTVETSTGQRFATLYKVTSYPHVALVDPRTGEQSKIILSGGPLSASDFVERVQDYIQRHTITPFVSDPLDSTTLSSSSSSSSSTTSTTSTTSMATATTTAASSGKSGRQREEEEEEAALQAALAASMVDVGGEDTSSSSSSSSSDAAPTPLPVLPLQPVVAVQNYGPVPAEPDSTSTKEETTRLRIRLSSGKQVVRKFRKDDTVRGLFAVVRTLLDAEGDSVVQTKEFELRAGYPPKILSGALDTTLSESNMENAQVTVALL